MKAVLIVLALASNGQSFVREEIPMPNTSLCEAMAKILDKAASLAAEAGQVTEVALATCETVSTDQAGDTEQ